jgi:hypothetical protein
LQINDNFKSNNKTPILKIHYENTKQQLENICNGQIKRLQKIKNHQS